MRLELRMAFDDYYGWDFGPPDVRSWSSLPPVVFMVSLPSP